MRAMSFSLPPPSSARGWNFMLSSVPFPLCSVIDAQSGFQGRGWAAGIHTLDGGDAVAKGARPSCGRRGSPR